MDRCYRPLLPSKAPSEDSVHSFGSPLDSVVTDHGPQDNSETRKKRQQIIVACNACRKRKSKVFALVKAPTYSSVQTILIRLSAMDKGQPVTPASTKIQSALGQQTRMHPQLSL